MKRIFDNYRKHLLSIFAFGTLALMAATMIVIGYWSLAPYKTIDFNNLPYKTEKTLYTQGEHTYYVVDYCKYTDVAPKLDKKFVDGLIFEALETRAVLTMGCHRVAIPLQIPRTLPPGEYHLEIVLTYSVNPIRDIVKTNESNKFIVTRNADGAYGDTSNGGITPNPPLIIKE